MLVGFKIITNDKNHTLVYMDKLIYFIATFQIFLSMVYFTFACIGNKINIIEMSSLLSSVKSMNILVSTMMCNILSSMIFDDDRAECVWSLLKVFLGLLSFEWFWTSVAHTSVDK
jgi:hypothetical protein